MEIQASRSRASSTVQSKQDVQELQNELKVFISVSQGRGDTYLQHHQHLVLSGHSLRQLLLEKSSSYRAQEVFRHLNGFQAILIAFENILRTLKLHESDFREHDSIQDLIQTTFGVLTAALHDHRGNQKYFRQCRPEGGWQALRSTFELLIEYLKERNLALSEVVIERLFGSLLSCATEDDVMVEFFGKLRRQLQSVQPRQGNDTASFNNLVNKEITQSTFLSNPEAMVTLLELWRGLTKKPAESGHSAESSINACFSRVPQIINHLATLSTRNLVALHGTAVLRTALSYILNPLNDFSTWDLYKMALTLLGLGVTSLDDAHLLFRNAGDSSMIAGLLIHALRMSKWPPYFHFDLFLQGFASIELPRLGHEFPPASSSLGYTILLRVCIVKFDPFVHTTLFGALDSSQTCFVLVYLEKDTQNLILQTSVTSSKPSVRFKSTTFQEGRWYHISIVHRRPRTTTSSRASLFIDGEFVEQVKSNYPASPPTNASNGGKSGQPSSIRDDDKAVQAFLGTPQDLAVRVGRGSVASQWRLASVHLIGDVISDDLIAVCYQLGPRYSGNFQDCLGSFQTYQASAELNLRNENLHPGREEKSDIISAIRSKNSNLLPESKIILSIAPFAILGNWDHHSREETQLAKALSTGALKNLRNVTRGGRNIIAINGSIPSFNEALLHPSGYAVLIGDPTVVIPQSLDDAAWRVGGCAALGLAILEAAHSHDSIIEALEILFKSVQDSWRNSEAMERESGFGVLANLLAVKLSVENVKPDRISVASANGSEENNENESLTKHILRLILDFVGYRFEKPEDSVINNPLAYRVLLVDFHIWRTSAPSVQELYYKQFTVFAVDSKYHQFNSKRLVRMRIVKKWLETLKGENFSTDTFDHFVKAFMSILTTNLSAESLRTLALYITYAICKPQPKPSLAMRPAKTENHQAPSFTHEPTNLDTTSVPIRKKANPSHKLSQIELGLKILDLYSDLLCKANDTGNIKKFARTVTNKWLLHLLADDEPKVVILAAKMLARLMVISGPGYVKKFVEKSGGITIMQYRLKRWWNIPTIWPICFAILFGRDIAAINLERNFDLYNLLEIFGSEDGVRIAYPEILPVLTGMLQSGLKSVTTDQADPDSPFFARSTADLGSSSLNAEAPEFTRLQTMSLSMELASLRSVMTRDQRLAESVSVLHTVTTFLSDMHSRSQEFRDFAVTSDYVQELLFLLFPVVVSSEVVSPEIELNSRDSALTFNGGDVNFRPLSRGSARESSLVKITLTDTAHNSKPTRNQLPKRMSSYILVSANETQGGPSPARLQPTLTPSKPSLAALNTSSSIVEELLEIIIAVFVDQLFSRKEFVGLGLFMKVPPGFQEHQAYFESFILRNSLSHLGNMIKLNPKLLWEPRVLTNLARFAGHLGESLYEGWFISGAEAVLDFLANILEYLQLPHVQKVKSIRLCSNIVSAISAVLLRVVLLRLSELDELISVPQTVSFLEKLGYWQTVLLAADNTEIAFLKLVCYLLYTKLVSDHQEVRTAAANLWRMFLVQKNGEISEILYQSVAKDSNDLTRGFKKVMELDNEGFLDWVNDNEEGLHDIFFGSLAKAWEKFVAVENSKTEEKSRARISKRREKLRLWIAEALVSDDILRRHEISSDHWRSNIHASEHLKRQRALQDLQDNLAFNGSVWAKMRRGLHRTCGVFDDLAGPSWELDQTEGRNRMRIRLIPQKATHSLEYQTKRKPSQGPSRHRRSVGVKSEQSVDPVAQNTTATINSKDMSARLTAYPQEIPEEMLEQEDDFEIVEDPRQENDDYEDKNRKVLRSLQRGDQVEHVHNVSRIIGLEACEGLLILGRSYLYLLDNLFQRSDGEIVNVWQAPSDERDSYLQMISGRKAREHQSFALNAGHETRSWRWDQVLSISKRRFLFRDVAAEVFFVDGRSYLLTANTPTLRDDLFQKLLGKVSNSGDRAMLSNEESWRMDSIRNLEENPQSFSSRLTNVFAHNLFNPSTRSWIRGEVSNFHYLMMVNTMAGRTFNDLTQYPVFPWVLADYTSDELDLSNPKSFRDLTKPMGCQNPGREAEFKSRYESFSEMGDADTPPFHYGTHYSSAMIVTSFLIRLQPFVQSYLLLQGGTFDHPDRLFYSVEKAWSSASSENMTDVRELIPEFYYLPEFLLNSNKFDFGVRQGDGGSIDTVTLPPWSKGDPKIFIAKHREALESEFVSRNLHHWIDLVFGQKQRGEAALEATNVFHHLSYHGAKDLESIDDPVERLATIGIIHNFGQTPHQVFQRNHPQRDESKHKTKRLDAIAESLTRLPFPLLENHGRVSSLIYSSKHDRLLCSGGYKLYVGPAFDKYMQWGFIDGGVRFYNADTKKLLGLFEHLHQGQISTAAFADSKTLITASMDCTVSVWTVTSTAKSVDLQPNTTFFGHRSPVTTLAISSSYSTLLSASSDGQVLLWDLNRLDLVRQLCLGDPVECAQINDITGLIMLGRGRVVSLYTLNGDTILEQDVCVECDDAVVSCAFYEGSGNEYLERDLIFTGQKKGVANIWSKVIRDGTFALEHVKRMNHLDQAGFNVSAALTCILPMAHTLYAGDEDGKVYEWDCIQRHGGR